MYKKIESYFAKHVYFNSTVHVLVGMGAGFLLYNVLAAPHPVRWGVLFLSLGILGHLYPLMIKK
ncbi:hypothetical protein HY386_01720 [Candidatus Daviesbacteria bacterium]|nr:hypothetical protein [Candidatus Daviesbacteria bacterium]